MDPSSHAPTSPRVTSNTRVPVDPVEGLALLASRRRGRGRGQGRKVRQARRSTGSERSVVPTEVLSSILASL